MNGVSSVRACALSRQFVTGSGQTLSALDGVSFVLPQAALVVVRGPSGCGKSTLLNLIGALDRASSGDLNVAGVDVAALAPDAAARFRRAYVGFLFQDAGLIEPMTVAENVAVPLVYRDVRPADRPSLIHKALDRVGLADRATSTVAELSGGERQRVGLARALVADPQILICDEPTAALDEDNSRAVVDMLSARAGEGRAVICSSHDPLLITRADVVVSLRHGRLDEFAS